MKKKIAILFTGGNNLSNNLPIWGSKWLFLKCYVPPIQMQRSDSDWDKTKIYFTSVPIILLQTPQAEGTPTSAAHNENSHRNKGLKIWDCETDMPQSRNPQAMPQQKFQQYMIFLKDFFKGSTILDTFNLLFLRAENLKVFFFHNLNFL